MTYSTEDEPDQYAEFEIEAVDIDEQNGVIQLLSPGIFDTSSPPPKILDSQGVDLVRVTTDNDEVFRVPVTSYVMLSTHESHADHDHKIFRQVPMLAVEFYSSVQDGEVELVSVQPCIRESSAVFGVLADDIDASHVSIMSLDRLIDIDAIVLLGYEHDGQRRDWSEELALMSSVVAAKEPGVVMDGKFRRLPRLELPDTPEGSNGDGAEA